MVAWQPVLCRVFSQFLQQYAHYKALLQLFLLNPSHESDRLEELVMFLSQVGTCVISAVSCDIWSICKCIQDTISNSRVSANVHLHVHYLYLLIHSYSCVHVQCNTYRLHAQLHTYMYMYMRSHALAHVCIHV